MSTPSTATAVHAHHHHHPSHFYPPNHNPHYSSDYQQTGGSTGGTAGAAQSSHGSGLHLQYGSYSNNNSNTANSTPDFRHAPSYQSKASSQHGSLAHSSQSSPNMPPPKRKANWSEFYKNGVPKEIIVIDDDSPDPSPQAKRPNLMDDAPRSGSGNATARHADKRRKIDQSTSSYDPGPQRTGQVPKAQPNQDDSVSNSTSSRGRSTAALHSTAPTSLTSTSSSSQRMQRLENTQAGQKRKRPQQRSEESDSEVEFINQRQDWDNYVPPPRPPIKAKEVYVKPVHDKHSASSQKCDDNDGHYQVVADQDLTERYTIVKLLGQGTFGKVVEAYDKKKATQCAIKIIRAVPKYRDASRIELRVLATLSSNDKHNRNRCIHLRECFDYRNHICIVTDLLSESVFDFLKKNSFVPFPSSHIQSFARQLFTSVAFLHDLNLIHTDLKPENILLVSNTYQTFTYNRNIPSSSKGTSRTAKQRKVLFDPEIRLIDFGSATFDDEYHSSVVSTRHYRAPEIILNLGWSFPCDIWSIGCILVEFFTGDALFQTHDNLEHLAMMESVCNGKIDKELIDKVRNGNKNGNRNSAAQPRAAALNYPSEETPRASKRYVKNMKKLDETIPPTTAFNNQFLDLLRRIFVYDPAKRITAQEALRHPWFKEKLQDDGTEALRIRKAKDRNGHR